MRLKWRKKAGGWRAVSSQTSKLELHSFLHLMVLIVKNKMELRVI